MPFHGHIFSAVHGFKQLLVSHDKAAKALRGTILFGSALLSPCSISGCENPIVMGILTNNQFLEIRFIPLLLV